MANKLSQLASYKKMLGVSNTRECGVLQVRRAGQAVNEARRQVTDQPGRAGNN